MNRLDLRKRASLAFDAIRDLQDLDKTFGDLHGADPRVCRVRDNFITAIEQVAVAANFKRNKEEDRI